MPAFTNAFFNQLTDRHKAEAVSAGTEPAYGAVGNDLSEAKPQNNGELAREAQSLIRMGCGDKCQRVQGCAGMIGF